MGIWYGMVKLGHGIVGKGGMGKEGVEEVVLVS